MVPRPRDITNQSLLGWIASLGLGNLLCGIVLLAASGLKLDMHLRRGDLGIVDFAVVVVEGTLGVFLCWKLSSKRLTLLGIFIFSTFCVYHFWEVFRLGWQYLRQPCSCFGASGFSSGLVLLIDFGCLFLLVSTICAPSADNNETISSNGGVKNRGLFHSIAILAASMLFLVAVFSNHVRRDLAVKWHSEETVDHSVEVLRTSSTVEIRNSTSRSMQYCGFSSSCMAVPVSRKPIEIPAHGKIAVEVSVAAPMSIVNQLPQHTIFVRDGEFTKAIAVSLNFQRGF